MNRNYRILLDLTPEAHDGGDSVTIHLIQFAEMLAARGCFIYVLTPSHIGGKTNHLLERKWFPRSCVVVSNPIPAGDAGHRKTSPDFTTALNKFSQTSQAPLYLIDGILGPMGSGTPALAKALGGVSASPLPHVMFEDCSGVLYPGEGSKIDDLLYPYDSNFVLTSALAAVQPTANVAYLTEAERTFALGSFKQRGLSPAHMTGVEKRTFVTGIPWGAECMARISTPCKKNEQITFCFGGTLNNEGTKRTSEVVAAYAEAAKLVGGRIVLTNMGETKNPKVLAAIHDARALAPVELIDNCSKGKFLDVLKTTHVYVNWSSSETYGLAVREACLFDNVVLSIDTPSSRLTMPEFEYRFMFERDHHAAVSALVAVAKDYPGHLEAQRGMRAKFLKLVSNGEDRIYDSFKDGILFRMESEPKDFFGNTSVNGWLTRHGNAPEAIGAFLDSKKGQTFRLYDVLTEIASVFAVDPTHYLQAANSIRMPHAYQLRNLLLYALGASDPCDSRMVSFTI